MKIPMGGYWKKRFIDGRYEKKNPEDRIDSDLSVNTRI
jgi:hypothetical protein